MKDFVSWYARSGQRAGSHKSLQPAPTSWYEYGWQQAHRSLSPASSAHNSGGSWQRLGRWMRQIFSPSSEPRIHQSYGPQGEVLWSAYDPASHQSIHRVSEDGLRRWLEQRYYFQNEPPQTCRGSQ